MRLFVASSKHCGLHCIALYIKRLTHEHIIHLVRLPRAISREASPRQQQGLNLLCDSFTITFPFHSRVFTI